MGSGRSVHCKSKIEQSRLSDFLRDSHQRVILGLSYRDGFRRQVERNPSWSISSFSMVPFLSPPSFLKGSAFHQVFLSLFLSNSNNQGNLFFSSSFLVFSCESFLRQCRHALKDPASLAREIQSFLTIPMSMAAAMQCVAADLCQAILFLSSVSLFPPFFSSPASLFFSPAISPSRPLFVSFLFPSLLLARVLRNGNTNAPNGSPTLWSSRRRASAFKDSYKPAFASQSRSIQFVHEPMKMSRSATQKPFAANKRRFSPGTWIKREKKPLSPFALLSDQRKMMLFNRDPRGSTLMFKSYKIHPKGNPFLQDLIQKIFTASSFLYFFFLTRHFIF